MFLTGSWNLSLKKDFLETQKFLFKHLEDLRNQSDDLFDSFSSSEEEISNNPSLINSNCIW